MKTNTRSGRIAKFLFSTLCEENKDLFTTPAAEETGPGRCTYELSWKQRVSLELFALTQANGKYEPEGWSYRVYTHELTDEELVDDECDYEVEHDGEYCETCAEKELAKRKAEDPENKHTIIGEQTGVSEAPMFMRCDSCDALFGYAYYVTKDELDHWTTCDMVHLDDTSLAWEAYELFTSQDYSGLQEPRYEAYTMIAKSMFELLKSRQK